MPCCNHLSLRREIKNLTDARNGEYNRDSPYSVLALQIAVYNSVFEKLPEFLHFYRLCVCVISLPLPLCKVACKRARSSHNHHLHGRSRYQVLPSPDDTEASWFCVRTANPLSTCAQNPRCLGIPHERTAPHVAMCVCFRGQALGCNWKFQKARAHLARHLLYREAVARLLSCHAALSRSSPQ
jgi:hypothetical protein